MAAGSRTLSWRRRSGLAEAVVEIARESLVLAAAEVGRTVVEAAADDPEAFLLDTDLGLHPPLSLAGVPSAPLVVAQPRPATDRRGGVVVALGADAVLRGEGWHEAFGGLGAGPVTISVLDPSQAGTATELLRALSEGRRVDVSTGAELVAAIDGSSLVIAFSTAIAVVAYARNVPFLLDREAPAAEAFLAPRGLASWTFGDSADLASRSRALLGLEIDLRPLAARDRRALVAWLEGREAADDAEASPRTNAPVLRPASADPPVRPAADARAGRNLRGMIERLDRDLRHLHHEVASQRDRIDELAAEVDRQSGEIDRRERLLHEIFESRAWRLITAIRGAAASLRGGREGGS